MLLTVVCKSYLQKHGCLTCFKVHKHCDNYRQESPPLEQKIRRWKVCGIKVVHDTALWSSRPSCISGGHVSRPHIGVMATCHAVESPDAICLPYSLLSLKLGCRLKSSKLISVHACGEYFYIKFYENVPDVHVDC